MKVILKSCSRLFLSSFMVKIVGESLLNLLQINCSGTALFEKSSWVFFFLFSKYCISEIFFKIEIWAVKGLRKYVKSQKRYPIISVHKLIAEGWIGGNFAPMQSWSRVKSSSFPFFQCLHLSPILYFWAYEFLTIEKASSKGDNSNLRKALVRFNRKLSATPANAPPPKWWGFLHRLYEAHDIGTMIFTQLLSM